MRFIQKIFFLIVGIISLIFFTSCDWFVIPKNIETEEDLRTIYSITKYSKDLKKLDWVISRYNLSKKESWNKYSDKLSELAKDSENFSRFRNSCVDRYIDTRKEDFIVKYYTSSGYNRNFVPSMRISDLTIEQFEDAEKAAKVYITVDKWEKVTVYKMEYYENNNLVIVLYKDHFAKAIKEIRYDKDEVAEIEYIF